MGFTKQKFRWREWRRLNRKDWDTKENPERLLSGA
jgi:hypothetical protein